MRAQKIEPFSRMYGISFENIYGIIEKYYRGNVFIAMVIQISLRKRRLANMS